MNDPAERYRTGWVAAAAAIGAYIVVEGSHHVLFGIDAYADCVASLPRPLRYLEQPSRWASICGIALWLTHRIKPQAFWRELGLAAPILTAAAFGLVATSPMLLPPLFAGRLSGDLDPLYLLFGSFIWPLAEEVLFRGYVFRQLHRRAGWGLWTAALFSSLLFGLAHLGNAVVKQQPIGEQAGTVVLIGGLSILGAWVFTRWDDNLWVLVALHGFMNLWWSVFELSDTPLGGVWANVLRLWVVPIAIGITLYRKPIAARIARMRNPQTAGS